MKKSEVVIACLAVATLLSLGFIVHHGHANFYVATEARTWVSQSVGWGFGGGTVPIKPEIEDPGTGRAFASASPSFGGNAQDAPISAVTGWASVSASVGSDEQSASGSLWAQIYGAPGTGEHTFTSSSGLYASASGATWDSKSASASGSF